MKQKLLFLVVLFLAFILVACQDKETQEETDKESENIEQEIVSKDERLEGTIRVSTANEGSQSAWEAVAEGYMEINEGVEVIIDNKPLDGYQEWMTAQFATSDTPDVDIVTANMLQNLIQDKKFVDYIPYFEQENPYTEKKWKESFNLDTMQLNLDAYKAREKGLYELNFESTQIMWVYNEDIFAEAGYNEPPQTFEEMMVMFKDIEELGYTPFSIGGNANSLWSGQAGWAIRIYADQYFRDSVKVVGSQEEDFSYFEPIDGKWEYNLEDPYNDNSSSVTMNELRMWKAINEKSEPYHLEGDRWTDFYENVKQLFGYAADGYTGMTDQEAYEEFINGNAAATLGHPGLYWQIPNDFGGDEGSESLEEFEFGFYNFPSIENENTLADARTIHLPIGFYGVVAKDPEQNALNIDFMQYWTSNEGYSEYLEVISESDNMAITGPPALNDINLPGDMEEVFSQFESVGNMENLLNASNVLARGLHNYQPNIQDWVNLTQQYFNDSLTSEEYLSQLQSNIDRDIVNAMEEEGIILEDLEHPERNTPERQ
ncbi:ABC transporter substrate-binding protein [Aquibacillus saliphilus]|uniref:ABC transporter substrate-binding protein n=1 Tax=Aquibacillus saliphilus TaxID=1909422 RepID=UPI001CEFDFA4|nr:ABC transporter substrate-binding protein [Aquibacillus saliphilus]